MQKEGNGMLFNPIDDIPIPPNVLKKLQDRAMRRIEDDLLLQIGFKSDGMSTRDYGMIYPLFYCPDIEWIDD
jgi:hypothetical protein